MKKALKSDTQKPFISIVIPVFNGAKHLNEAVSSVYRSTYKQFEILLVDNRSTDESKSICKKLARKYAKVRFYDFPRNKGLGRVLNFALKKAKGEYICRLNQDDRVLPHRLATQVRFLEAHPEVVALGSSIRLFDNKGNRQIVQYLEKDEDIKKIWHIVSPFSDPSVMYRKAVALAARGYDQAFWPADDTHLWYRMGLRGKLANLKKPVVEVRWHDSAASVKFFRTLALKTYKMHLWADQYVSRAPWYVQIYWFIQLFAGLTLSPQVNWGIYRLFKRGIHAYQLGRERITQIYRKITKTEPVTSQTKKLNLSGV